MKILLENIGKIDHAEIGINGITVIAGENNTGKSTVGKALYAMTELLCGFQDYVKRDIEWTLTQQVSSYGEQLEMLCRENFLLEQRFRRKTGKADKLVDQCVKQLYLYFEEHKRKKVETTLDEFTKRYIELYKTDYEKSLEEALPRLHTVTQNVLQYWDVEENELGIGRATSVFSGVFNGQINNVANVSADGVVILEDDYGKQSKVLFRGDKSVSIEYRTPIFETAYFVENPRDLDRLSYYSKYSFSGIDIDMSDMQVSMKRNLKKLLSPKGGYSVQRSSKSRKNPNETVEDNLSDLKAALMQKKYDKVLQLLKKAVPGEYKIRDGVLQYCEPNTEMPIRLENLSTGLKSMVLIERLLSMGLLCSDSIIIFDEPEINLHPEWQLLYAQIVVILQQVYDIKILLTTHSPYFLKAIKMYAQKDAIMDKCKFYSAENIDGNSKLKDVTENTNILFQTLAEPLRELKRMEFEV